MANRRMALTEEGKIILDKMADLLEVERPMAVKIAFAKGLAHSSGRVKEDYTNSKNKWTIPDSIIKDKEFLLFKHLIINEVKQPLNDDDLHKHMLAYIEKGLRILNKSVENKTSMEDLRISILENS